MSNKKFNLKSAQYKGQYKNYNKMLEDDTKDLIEDAPVDKNINQKLNKREIKEVVHENRMDAERQGEDDNKVIEKNLNTNDKLNIADRNDMWDTSIKPENLLSEAYDQKKIKVFKDNMETEQERDTDFWDKYIGEQMIDKNDITKIVKNNAPSQLPNESDRFKNITPKNVIKNKINIKKRVMASLKEADANLLNTYLVAFSNDRDLNKIEKEKISKINNYKKNIIAQFGKVEDKPHLSEFFKEKAKEDALREISVDEKENKKRDIKRQEEIGEEYQLDIKPQPDGTVFVYNKGTIIDIFDKYDNADENIEDATAQYYPYV